MRSNSKKSRHGTALLLILPFLFAISGDACANPGKKRQTTADTSSFVIGTAVTEPRTWDWQSNPEAYQPDGLSDYSEDFATVRRQTIYRDVALEATPGRAVTIQAGTVESR